MAQEMSVKEAAMFYKKDKKTIYEWVKAGKLKSRPLAPGSREILVTVPGANETVQEDKPTVPASTAPKSEMDKQLEDVKKEHELLTKQREIIKLRAELNGGIVQPDEVEAFRKEQSEWEATKASIRADAKVAEKKISDADDLRETLNAWWTAQATKIAKIKAILDTLSKGSKYDKKHPETYVYPQEIQKNWIKISAILDDIVSTVYQTHQIQAPSAFDDDEEEDGE